VQLLPDVVPQLCEIRQQGSDEIRVTKISDMSELAAAGASCVPEPWRNNKDRMVSACGNYSFFLLQSLAE
jgi:hypothetical protein